MPIAVQDISFGNPIATLRSDRPAMHHRVSRYSRHWSVIHVPANYPAAPVEIHTIADLQMGNTAYIRTTSVHEPEVLSDLRLLREEELESEVPITQHAYSKTADALVYVNTILSEDLPNALIAPDGNGGVRIEWFRENRNVRVLIPARSEQPAFIYQRTNRDSAVHNFSRAALVQTLRSVILT